MGEAGAALVPLLFLIVPAALVLGAIFGVPRLIDRRRQRAYAAFCLPRGYQYQPGRPGAEAQYADVVGLFKSGGSHKWRHEISGLFNGRSFTAFEYQYATGTGRRRTAFNLAMLHWRPAGVSLPHFTLEPASTYLFRIGRTPQDVDFPEDKAFSKAYVLRGQDQVAIRALFTPERRAALIGVQKHQVAAGGQELFFWQEQGLPPPDQFEAFLNEGTPVLEIFAANAGV